MKVWLTGLWSVLSRLSRSDNSYIFDIAKLETLAERFSTDYAEAMPFRHAVIDDFLPPRVAKQLFSDFPPVESEIWIEQHPSRQPGKLGITHASRLRGIAPLIANVVCQFNSYPFLNFLTKLAGISKLLPDPYLHGGGPQQILNGGRLDVHADFTYLPALDLYRRINVLYYLNPDWKPEFGGKLEFWSASASTPKFVKSIAPKFNRLVVFDTKRDTYHGHPKPLSVPQGVTRKALAFYYYTAQPEQTEQYTERTFWINQNASNSGTAKS